jgi:hypothetical protein
MKNKKPTIKNIRLGYKTPQDDGTVEAGSVCDGG